MSINKDRFMASFGDSDATEKAIFSDDRRLRSNATKNPTMSSDLIHKILSSHTDKDVRADILHQTNTNILPQHITKALNDGDNYVRFRAARHQNATPEHINKALEDSDKDVRLSALDNINTNKDHIEKAMNDGNIEVATKAKNLSKIK